MFPDVKRKEGGRINVTNSCCWKAGDPVSFLQHRTAMTPPLKPGITGYDVFITKKAWGEVLCVVSSGLRKVPLYPWYGRRTGSLCIKLLQEKTERFERCS